MSFSLFKLRQNKLNGSPASRHMNVKSMPNIVNHHSRVFAIRYYHSKTLVHMFTEIKGFYSLRFSTFPETIRIKFAKEKSYQFILTYLLFSKYKRIHRSFSKINIFPKFCFADEISITPMIYK